MDKADIINYYLKKFQPPKSYLEIGIKNKEGNFNKIQADHKDGVDPDHNSKCNYIMTSDKFFAKNTTKYDLIFIDGLHTYEQAYKDVISSLRFLKDHGIIIMHDCNPENEFLQREPGTKSGWMEGGWCGTVWKAFVRIGSERDDLEMFVVDTDHGVGVLKSNRIQKKLQCPDNIYTYKIFDQYRKEVLNLISVDEFLRSETTDVEETIPILQKGPFAERDRTGLQRYFKDIDTRNKIYNIESLAKTFSKVNDIIKLNGSILDVGCGNGRINEIYKNYFNRIVGIDKFRQPNKIYQYPNFEYRNFDIFECNENNEFDIISFVGSFYLHCNYGEDGYLKTLKKASKLLKNRGCIIIVENKDSNRKLLENKAGHYNLEDLCFKSKLEIVNLIIHENCLAFYIIKNKQEVL